MRLRVALVCAGLAGALPALALAQGSVFGLRGLGWAGRPVSARTAATGGGLSMFDPEMNLNPAALSRWRSVAAWGVGAPTKRSYTSPSVSSDQQTVRFPLFGFATVLPPRIGFGFSISDYLDRTWTLTETDSVNLRGTMEKFTNAGRSIGGVSDMQLGGSYEVNRRFFIGLGLHYYLGSSRLTAQRIFTNLNYESIVEGSQTDYRGGGVTVGALWTLRALDLSVSGTLNGSLRSHNTSGSVAHTQLPNRFAAGLRWQVVPGVYVAGSAQYDGWARASSDIAATGSTALNVWSVGVGAEVQRATIIGLHTPLRVGYRTRTLPFTTQGSTITESGLSGGFGLNLARDRTTIDVAVESGKRTAGSAKETFQSIFLGVTVRP